MKFKEVTESANQTWYWPAWM